MISEITETAGSARGAAEDGALRQQRPTVADELLARTRGAQARGWTPPFRGSLVENCAGAPMIKGHGNDGQPFDIETACYLKPLVRAYHLATTRKMVVMAAVKTLKSFFVEMAAAYHLCHSIGDVGIFFGSGEVAEDVSSTRILSYYEGIRSYADKLRTIVGQYDITMGAVKFPDKTFFLKPANLAQAQQKNLGFVGVQDGFVTGTNGMIDQLLERTKQYPEDKKIVLESQGGEYSSLPTGIKFDFDRHYRDTDQRELHVNCPLCGVQHIFNWKVYDPVWMTRGENFTPRPPLSVPSLDHAAWTEHHRPLLMKPERRIAGFRRGPDDLIKLEDGEYDEAAVLRETHFECFHCGGIWRDDGRYGATRIALDVSAGRDENYVPARLNALVSNVGFNFPQWINRRLPWGEIMLEKLKRQQLARQGNAEPLKQWWQKFAARSWDPEIAQARQLTVSPGSYDPGLSRALYGENFHSVNMAVDCQQNQEHMDATGKSITGWFWFVVRMYDKLGNSRQLARGYCKSWEAWQAVQRHWQVPNDRVIIDSVQWGDMILAKAVECREAVKLDRPHPIFKTLEKVVTWKLLAASPGKTNFRGHRDGMIRPWSAEAPVKGTITDGMGRLRGIPIMRLLFNKTPVQQQVDALYSGAPGLPKFEVLKRDYLKLPNGEPDALTLQMESGMRTYENQMSAQIYSAETNKYVELRPDDHYYWCEQALLVRAGMDGLLGQSAVFTEEVSSR